MPWLTHSRAPQRAHVRRNLVPRGSSTKWACRQIDLGRNRTESLARRDSGRRPEAVRPIGTEMATTANTFEHDCYANVSSKG
jgi:hypothetical protein